MMKEPQPDDLGKTLSQGSHGILSRLKAIRAKAIQWLAKWWRTVDPADKKLLQGLGVCIALIAVILAVVWIPHRQLAPLKAKIQRERQSLQPHDRLKLEHDARKLENEARTALIQGLGGAALLIGLYFTAKAWRTSQEGQITDRFTKAVNQLGEAGPGKLATRLGGIYALERITRESARDYWPIMEVLTAYVREYAPWPPSTSEPAEGADQRPEPAADIEAIMTVLGRRHIAFGRGRDESLDLCDVDLRGAALGIAHLERVDFSGAHLEGAILMAARLRGAHFWQAHLEGASLDGADVRAILFEAHLEGAVLIGAHLEGAILGLAHLEKADLRDANLEKAFLLETHLDEAILAYARLEGAIGLTVEQLSTVRTLYQAHLDPPLLEQIRQRYPHLLEESSMDGLPMVTVSLIYRPDPEIDHN